MDLLLFAVGLIGMIVSLILLVINLIRKKPMKKMLISLGVCFILFAVGLFMPSSSNNDDSETQAKLENNELEVQSEQEEQEEVVYTQADTVTEDKPTQEELNIQLKEEAIEADFVNINGDKVEKGTKLHLKGEVSVIDSIESLGKFSITTKENDGFGMYDIINFTGEKLNIKEGDIIEVWGVYNVKDENTGMPTISMTVYEKESSNEGAQTEDIETEENTEIIYKSDFQKKAEENAKKYPADSVASFEGEKFKGMDYYYKGTIIDIVDIENNVGDTTSWLVKSERGYLMPIQFYEFEADIGDEVEVWGTLSGNMFSIEDTGYEAIIDKVGSIHAMLVTINGE